MKKLFTILMALMVLSFSQCKPTPENGDGEKVKITCEIPINGGSRSDFSNLLTNGKINWSHGTEYVYLAIHGAEPQIIELSATAVGYPYVLMFEGEVEAGVIQDDEEYDIWYFGDSREKGDAYYQLLGGSNGPKFIKGSLAQQSGQLDDLGDCHIATTKVVPTISEVDRSVKLSLTGTLKNQIAILLLNLENVNELYGDAIVGTEYSLEYNGDRYEFKVVEKSDAKISIVQPAVKGMSYIALLPNVKENTEIRYDENNSIYECIIYGEIKSNQLYYKANGDKMEVLEWHTVSSGGIDHDGHVHRYVDLGLPSKTLWAIRNVGADTIYEYGDYFAWGEIETKYDKGYLVSNSNMLNKKLFGDTPVSREDSIVGISGNANYDAATAIWGEEWRMPTNDECRELFVYCKREPMKMPTPITDKTPNGYVNGYMFTGPNGNHIFLPAAGWRDSETYNGVVEDIYKANIIGHYWHSSVLNYNGSGVLHLESGWSTVDYYASRHYGCTIRPVMVKKADEIK